MQLLLAFQVLPASQAEPTKFVRQWECEGLEAQLKASGSAAPTARHRLVEGSRRRTPPGEHIPLLGASDARLLERPTPAQAAQGPVNP